MDLTKSRSLIFLCPNSLDTAALFSFCLHTIHSLQLIKLKKPEKKVGNKVNKVLCLRGNKKKTILFKNQKNLLEITKLKAELLSKKLKDNTEEISQNKKEKQMRVERRQDSKRKNIRESNYMVKHNRSSCRKAKTQRRKLSNK